MENPTVKLINTTAETIDVQIEPEANVYLLSQGETMSLRFYPNSNPEIEICKDGLGFSLRIIPERGCDIIEGGVLKE